MAVEESRVPSARRAVGIRGTPANLSTANQIKIKCPVYTVICRLYAVKRIYYLYNIGLL